MMGHNKLLAWTRNGLHLKWHELTQTQRMTRNNLCAKIKPTGNCYVYTFSIAAEFVLTTIL